MISNLIKSLIFCSILFLIACNSNEQVSEYPIELENSYQNKEVVISGVIENFDTVYNHLFIKTRVYDILSNKLKTESEPIYNDGKYSISFPLDRPQEFELLFADHAVTFFAKPGDQLTINLDYKYFSKKTLDAKAIDVVNNGVNQIMWNYYQGKKRKKLFANVDSTSVSLFSDWKNGKNKYEKARKWVLKDSLQKGVSIDNYNASPTKGYHEYLCEYENYLIKNFRRSNKHLRHAKDTLILKSELNYIVRKTTGYARDVLVARYFYLEHERILSPNFESYIDFYLEKIKSNALREKVKNHLDEHKEEDNSILSTGIIQDGKTRNIFKLIREQHKGKVVYLDFWATWCTPCIREMPIYKKLREDLDEDDVAFVYLAINSPEQLWKSMSKTLGLKGFNHLMTQEEYDQIDRLFYVETIPHHALMDKKGNIAMDMAPHPSKGNGVSVNDKLIKTIHQLLVQ